MNDQDAIDSACSALRDRAQDSATQRAELDETVQLLRALLRRDWAVRVLDAWQQANVLRAEPFRCYAPFDLEVDAPLNWLCMANADDGVSRRFLATTPDAARHAAALSVFQSLPEATRKELGESP